MTAKTKCIIVIDDEKDACDFIKSFLANRGYTVYVAFTGNEGFNLIRDKGPGLVLLDVKLPDINGIEVLAKLRKEDQVTKVVLMTGVESGENIDRAEELKITSVLNKPIKLLELDRIIKEEI